MIFAGGSKSHGIFNVFFPRGEQRHSAVFSLLQELVSTCGKRKNNVFHDVFALARGTKGAKMAPKRTLWRGRPAQPSLIHLGTMLAHFEAMWATCGAMLPNLGVMFAELGAMLARLGVMLAAPS